jgi:hypothetical protein
MIIRSFKNRGWSTVFFDRSFRLGDRWPGASQDRCRRRSYLGRELGAATGMVDDRRCGQGCRMKVSTTFTS